MSVACMCCVVRSLSSLSGKSLRLSFASPGSLSFYTLLSCQNLATSMQQAILRKERDKVDSHPLCEGTSTICIILFWQIPFFVYVVVGCFQKGKTERENCPKSFFFVSEREMDVVTVVFLCVGEKDTENDTGL